MCASTSSWAFFSLAWSSFKCSRSCFGVVAVAVVVLGGGVVVAVVVSVVEGGEWELLK